MSEESAKQPLRVGVVGLGTIGAGIATSWARRGRLPVVFDIRRENADGLLGAPTLAGSPAEVASASDVVCVAVVDAEQVTHVVCGPDGLLSGAHPRLVIVITATIAVRVIRDLAQRCSLQGVSLIDCGVLGGDKAADNGLVVVVGGAGSVVAAVRPVLEDFAGEVIHCGPLGTGMAAKLSRQIVTAGRWRAVHEAFALASAAGVDPALFLHVIEASDQPSTVEHDGKGLLGLQRLRMAGQTVDVSSRSVRVYIRNVDKDMEAAQQLAGETGVTLPLVDLTRAQTYDTFAWLEAAERSAGGA
jgi:3-hydroxyisobutyrate dehydrogenase-like beta-hydroxyacid dehydrogenase